MRGLIVAVACTVFVAPGMITRHQTSAVSETFVGPVKSAAGT